MGDHAGQGEISLRAYLRGLRWIAPASLVVVLAMWVLDRPQGMSLTAALVFWALFTLAAGPLMWLRIGRYYDAPGWWRALGLALLWFLGVGLLFGVGYALVMLV
jgi:hypothetical protein